MSVMVFSMVRLMDEEKLSLMTDKCGEVVRLMVERAMGIQGRPPSLKSSEKPKVTSWMFRNLEKSKDRSKIFW